MANLGYITKWANFDFFNKLNKSGLNKKVAKLWFTF